VQVYLRERLSGGSPSLLVTEDGLFSAVAQLSLTGPPPTAPATITGASRDATNFDDFNDSSVTPGGAQATVGGTRDPGDLHGTPIIVDDANTRRVSIGTFAITAGGVPSQTTTFQLADRPGTFDTLTWTNGTVLDPQIAPSTLTIVTTPEPSMAGLALTVAATLACRPRRRRCVDARSSIVPPPDIPCLNLTLSGTTLVATMRKPFDELAEGLAVAFGEQIRSIVANEVNADDV